MNVTALLDADTGDAVERYMYDAYGKATFLDGDWEPTEVEGRQDGAASAYASDVLFAGYRFDAERGLDATDTRICQATLGRWPRRDAADTWTGRTFTVTSPATP
jgi:hypothetical protein